MKKTCLFFFIKTQMCILFSPLGWSYLKLCVCFADFFSSLFVVCQNTLICYVEFIKVSRQLHVSDTTIARSKTNISFT